MIERLPPHLIHQIAAGEVIERPASALKELIENALDAKSQAITIRFRSGGKDLLEVEDDGRGILEQDLPLTFESHATSKLKRMEDFDDLQTYGFRGEALASMGSVADVTLESSFVESSSGALLRNSFGQIFPVVAINKRVGTKMSVKNLFERLPARREFLKSERAESQALWSMIRKYALARPEMRFVVGDLDGDRTRSYAPGSLFERALDVLGVTDANLWFEVSEASSAGSVRMVGVWPRSVSLVKSGIYVFLNGRPIRDLKVEAAVRRAYEGFTEFPREASVVMHLNLLPSTFDVNVHPMKTEVRFKSPDAVFSLVHRSLRNLFLTAHQSSSEVASATPRPADSRSALSLQSPRDSTEPALSQSTQTSTPTQVSLWGAPKAEVQYLFSIDHTYLVCERAGELLLFDQHALHERVLYESLLRQWNASQKIASQRLLFPVTLSWQNAGDLLEFEEQIQQLGFEVRSLSAGRVSVVSVPSIVKRNPESILKSLLETWEGGREVVLRDVLATMACHSAVRAHDVLRSEEIKQLLGDFESEDALGHCPHGRPTFVKLRIQDLEKLFHRVL